MASWGNEEHEPYQQDMESPQGYSLTVNGTTTLNDGLYVADGHTELSQGLDVAGDTVLHGGDTTIQGNVSVENNHDITVAAGGKVVVGDLNGAGNALETTNGSGLGNALQVNGKTSLNGEVKVNNDSILIDGGGLAINVNSDGYALNTRNTGAGKALYVDGNSQMEGNLNVDGNIVVEASHGIKVNDLNTVGNAIETVNSNDGGKALMVTGKSSLDGDVDVVAGNKLKINDLNSGAGNALETINTGGGKALKVEGISRFDGDIEVADGHTLKVYNLNAEGNALESINTGAGKALKVEGDSQFDGNVELDAGHTMKVNDLNTAGNALETINTGAGKALKVQGNSQFDGNVELDAGHTLKVNDLNTAGNALEAINSGAGNALKVNGKSSLEGNLDIVSGHTLKVNDLNTIGDALEVINSNIDGNALRVSGKSRLNGDVDMIGDVDVDGNVEIDAGHTLKVNDLNAASTALETINSSADPAARALKVNGKTELDENGLIIQKVTNINRIDSALGNHIGIGTQSPSTNVQIGREGEQTWIWSDETHVNGILRVKESLESKGTVEDPEDLIIGTEEETADVLISKSGQTTKIKSSQLHVGPSGAAGEIDSGGVDEESKQDLKIGTGDGTDDVVISKQDQVCVIDCNLRVGRKEIDDIHTSRIDAYGHNGLPDLLCIGTLEHTNEVHLGRSDSNTVVKGDLEVKKDLHVGPSDDHGMIDAANNARDLKIGTDVDHTNNVEIGRTGKEVDVKGRIDAEEHVRVGTGAIDGKVDASATNRDLKIGTNTTNDVILSRGGKTTDIMGNTRHNSMEVIMNDAANLTAANGCGFKYNAAGHDGPNDPCIDFYINGAVVGYIDADGWHNL